MPCKTQQDQLCPFIHTEQDRFPSFSRKRAGCFLTGCCGLDVWMCLGTKKYDFTPPQSVLMLCLALMFRLLKLELIAQTALALRCRQKTLLWNSIITHYGAGKNAAVYLSVYNFFSCTCYMFQCPGGTVWFSIAGRLCATLAKDAHISALSC